jgi:hypothetical protein
MMLFSVYDVIFSVPLHILTSSGEAAEERNRGAAQRAERWRGGATYELGSGDKHNLIVPSDAT